jgi:enterochelin esterase family protein
MTLRTHAAFSIAGVAFALPFASAVAQPAAEVDEAGDTPAYLELRGVSHGDVHTLKYRSESLDIDREAIVYLPPGYSISSEPFPVLYLLHGAGGDERTWIDRQQANVILDNLIADGRLKPLVVVMPFGYTSRRGMDERRGAEGYKQDMEEFAVDFMNDLVPLVESRYKIAADREHRAIAGLSMGGGQSLAIGLTHPDMFNAVAGFSSAMQIANSPDWGGIDMDATLAANADAINEHLDLLWVGCGTEDTLFNVNRAFSAQLTEHGVEHVFRVTLGGHTPEVWSRYLHELAPQLF